MRGKAQYLYDADDKAFLDGVNNVRTLEEQRNMVGTYPMLQTCIARVHDYGQQIDYFRYLLNHFSMFFIVFMCGGATDVRASSCHLATEFGAELLASTDV